MKWCCIAAQGGKLANHGSMWQLPVLRLGPGQGEGGLLKPLLPFALLVVLAVGCGDDRAAAQADVWVLLSTPAVLHKIEEARQAGDLQTLRSQWERSRQPLGRLTYEEKQRVYIGSMNLAVALLDDTGSRQDCYGYLVRMKGHADPLVRENLALALGGSDSTDTMELLRELAMDGDERVVRAAVESLAWRSRR